MARSNERRLERLLNARTAGLEMQLAERLVAEQMLRRAQRLESIGHLTCGIAHDFNNLLQVIIGNLALLEKRTSDLANAHLIIAALEAAQRSASLTRRLMTFRAGMCSNLISGVTGLLIHVQYQLQATRAVCHLDREAFKWVILKLAVNARHAMPDGGTLTIETDTLHVVSAGADENLSPEDYLRIAMHDTGQGMTDDVMARAFDSFFTTKALDGGSGPGLSQARGFATRAGGHAALESAIGKGTSVILFLPLAAGAEQVVEGAAEAEPDFHQPFPEAPQAPNRSA